MKLEHNFNKNEIDFILSLIGFIKDNRNSINKNNRIVANGYSKEFVLSLMSKSMVLIFNNKDFIVLSIDTGVQCENYSMTIEINYKALEYLDFIEKELS